MRTKGLFILLIVALFISGCASGRMSVKEMYSGPNFSAAKEMPSKLTVFAFALNQRLDVTDSAMFVDWGIETPSLSWKFIVWHKLSGDKYETIEALAIRYEDKGKKFLLAVLPDVEIGDEDFVAVSDHAGRRIYNQQGQSIMANWRSLDPEKYKGFMTTVKASNSKTVAKESKEFNDLVEFGRRFRIAEAIQFRNVVYNKYNIPAGTVLTEKELKIFEDDPWFQDKIKKALLSNWKILITYPIMSPVTYGAYILIAKVFDVSSLWFEDDPREPGYMDRPLTAATGYDMVQYQLKNYGPVVISPDTRSTTVITGSGSALPEKLRAELKKITGKDFSTYDEYNAFVAEYNTGVIAGKK